MKDADKQKPPIDTAKLESGRCSEGHSFLPFELKELQRSFVKNSTGFDGATVEQAIENSWDGLLSHFAGPNIRHKVRHPLFLAIRFRTVLIILHDTVRFSEENEDSPRSFICVRGFLLRCKRDLTAELGHGEFLPAPPLQISSPSAASRSWTAPHMLGARSSKHSES
jgi:hypothetical protein